ncbi:MAG: aldo/keto reductase [Deltaproteobacteria bacterium]|nr:aldo/keto reductase [Deltaproteobacteria bacterium]
MLRTLGRTGIQVFAIGMGAMPLSLRGRPDEAAAERTLRAALDAGVNFFDTANSYCVDDQDTGHNERLLATLLRKLGVWDRVLVATKGGFTRPGGGWRVDARPASLRKACEQSLRDLGVETIALYQLHHPDTRAPWEDSVGELSRLRGEGKIHHIGLSNVNSDQIRSALSITPVVSVQNECNPKVQGDLHNGVVRLCEEQGLTYIAYCPVGGGSGHRSQSRNPTLVRLARERGVSAYQVMLAWLLSKGNHMLPIPGASRPESIQDSARAVAVALDEQAQRQVDLLR